MGTRLVNPQCLIPALAPWCGKTEGACAPFVWVSMYWGEAVDSQGEGPDHVEQGVLEGSRSSQGSASKASPWR